VETRPATNVTATTATLNARIVSTGGAAILERRFDWGIGPGGWTDWTANVVVSGNDFSFNLTGLSPNTTYGFRAWARNSAGWGHGTILTFNTPPPAPVLSVTPPSLDFGNVTVGTTSDLNFTVTNTGGGTLTGTASVPAGPFSIAAGATYSIAAGATHTVTVRFAPTATGPVSATVTFTGGGGATRPVSGTGVAAVVAPTVETRPATNVTATSATLNARITSDGGAPIIGRAFEWRKEGTATWTWVLADNVRENDFSSNLIGLRPNVTYEFRARAQNRHPEWGIDPGWGTGAILTFTTPSAIGHPALSVTPASLDFGSVPVGSSRELSFTVTNTGSGTLTGNASVPAPFSIVAGSSFSLGERASTTVTVRFSPAATGLVSATVSFTSNGGNLTREVSGTGVEVGRPALSVTPASLDFGNVTVGESHYLAFTVTNTGIGTLEGRASLPAGPFSIVGRDSFSLRKDSSTVVIVRFRPAAAGLATATVAFTSNGGNLTREVSGTGVEVGRPTLSVTPASLDIGRVSVGSESLKLVFTVTNTGTGTLTGSATVAAPFRIVDGGLFSIEAGKSARVTVKFSPTEVGSANDVVTFTSNGGDLTGGIWGIGVASGEPALSVTPAFLDIGEVPVGEFRDITFTVTNIGLGTLTGSATVIPGPFSIVGRSDFSLEAGKEAGVTVRFTPTEAVLAGEVVTFSGSRLDRHVFGTGVVAPVRIDPVHVAPGGCFIATAAFGTPLAEEVEILSRLRDEYLLTNEWGKRFVTFYYQHSPAVARFIREREWAKRAVRIALLPIVRIAEFIVGEE
jgi:hypothetical protein